MDSLRTTIQADKSTDHLASNLTYEQQATGRPVWVDGPSDPVVVELIAVVVQPALVRVVVAVRPHDALRNHDGRQAGSAA